MRLYRKMLILFISLLDKSKILININGEQDFFQKFIVSESIRLIYSIEIVNSGNYISERLPICKDLKTKSLKELINLINIEDLQFYQLINRIHIDQRSNPRRFSVMNTYGRTTEFGITFKEKTDILCSKVQTKEEIFNFAFKFLRNKILLKFEKENGLNLENNLENFNRDTLNNNPGLISLFHKYSVSGKDLIKLREYPLVENLLRDHFSNFFILELLENILSLNKDKIISQNVCGSKFLELCFSRKKDYSLTLQDVLNSFQVLKSHLFDKE